MSDDPIGRMLEEARDRYVADVGAARAMLEDAQRHLSFAERHLANHRAMVAPPLPEETPIPEERIDEPIGERGASGITRKSRTDRPRNTRAQAATVRELVRVTLRQGGKRMSSKALLEALKDHPRFPQTQMDPAILGSLLMRRWGFTCAVKPDERGRGYGLREWGAPERKQQVRHSRANGAQAPLEI